MLATAPLSVVADDALTANHTREYFLETRSTLKGEGAATRFGGSSLGDIIHVGYNSPYKLFDEAMHGEKPQVANQAMLDGIHYETPARVGWELLTGEFIERVPTRPWGEDYIVSPDGLVCDEGGRVSHVIEFKVPHVKSVPYVLEWDGIPIRYWPQLELYCRAYGVSTAHLVFALRNRDEETLRFFDMSPREMAEFLRFPLNRKRAFEHYYARFYYSTSDGFAAYLQHAVDHFRFCLTHNRRPTPKTWITRAHACENALVWAKSPVSRIPRSHLLLLEEMEEEPVQQPQ